MTLVRRELASGKLRLEEPTAGVTRITVRNRDKRGMLDQEILDALATTLPTLTAQCLIVTGEGNHFSAGYDIEALHERPPTGAAGGLLSHPSNAALQAIERYPYPVLAALNGHTVGGGLELAMACDLRVASRDASLAMTPGKLGLVYSHTGLRRFLDVCGLANTNEMFFLATPVDAERAREMGLVNRVVDAAIESAPRSRWPSRSAPRHRSPCPATSRPSALSEPSCRACPTTSSGTWSTSAPPASPRPTSPRRRRRSSRSARRRGRGARRRFWRQRASRSARRMSRQTHDASMRVPEGVC